MYHFHHLTRATDTTAANYGYTGTVGYNWDAIHGHGLNFDLGARWDDVFGVGEIIAYPDAHPRLLPLAKSLECDTVANQIIITERLFYGIDNKYWPYRIRVRTPTRDDIITNINAIAKIHKHVDRQEHTFVDPRLAYMRAWAESSRHTHSATAWKLYALVEQHPPFAAFGTHSLSPEHTQHDLISLSTALSHTSDLGEKYGVRMINHVLPELPVFNGLTLRGAVEPISDAALRGLCRSVCTDTTVPGHLSITHPCRTQFNVDTHANEAHQVDRLAASDVDIEYILLHGAIVNTTVHQYYDRFMRLTNREMDDIRVLHQIARMFSYRYAPRCQRQTDLDRNIRVRIQRTFNEEALFEIGYADEREPMAVYYYDLAALSLCGIGLTTQLCA